MWRNVFQIGRYFTSLLFFDNLKFMKQYMCTYIVSKNISRKAPKNRVIMKYTHNHLKKLSWQEITVGMTPRPYLMCSGDQIDLQASAEGHDDVLAEDETHSTSVRLPAFGPLVGIGP